MKKIFTSFVIMISGLAMSQNSEFSYGFHSGLNYSQLSKGHFPGEVDSKKPMIFVTLGAKAAYQLNDRFKINVELNYERKSSKTESEIEVRNDPENPQMYINDSFQWNLDYLIMPVTAQYCFSDENSFYLNGGIFMGYLLNAKIKYSSDSTLSDFPNSDEIDLNSNLKKFDYGLVVGLGKNFQWGNDKNLYLELRENFGLNNISDMNSGFYTDVKTNGINLVLGVMFN